MTETSFLQSVFLGIKASEPVVWIESPDDSWIIAALQAQRKTRIQFCDTVPDFAALESVTERTVIVWNNVTPQALATSIPNLARLARRLRSALTCVVIAHPSVPRPAILSSIPVMQAPLPDFDARRSLIGKALGTAFPLADDALDALAAASAGLQRTQIFRTLARASVEAADATAFDAWESRIIAEKKRLLATELSVEVVDDTATLDDVGGADELKLWIRQRRAVFTDAARRFGLQPPKGVLLVGIQGCGKSLIAKAIANAWHFPLLKLDISSIFAISNESPDAALRRALQIADAMSPAVIWCDEIEKAFAAGADATTRRLLGHILNWLQERPGQSFFVATANDVRELPSELIRKGRFDELFFIDLPDADARADIFRIHLQKRHRDPDAFDCPRLAALAQNFSGAEIEQAVISALFAAFHAGRDLTHDDICDAIHDTVPLFKQREEDIKQLREWATERTRKAANNARLLSYFQSVQ